MTNLNYLAALFVILPLFPIVATAVNFIPGGLTPKTYADAENDCFTKYGTHLASVYNSAHIAEAVSLMSGSGLPPIWIGLNDKFTEVFTNFNGWQLLSGGTKNLDPSLFAAGYPVSLTGNEDCMMLQQQGTYKMMNVDCTTTRAYICDAPPTKAPTKVPTNSPTTVSPTNTPTNSPTFKPSSSPTTAPTFKPTTSNPTLKPTISPTYKPSTSPTSAPTHPTIGPSRSPTFPTSVPSQSPSEPTNAPTKRPSASPTQLPSTRPTNSPHTASPTTTSEPTSSSPTTSSNSTVIPTSAPVTHAPTGALNLLVECASIGDAAECNKKDNSACGSCTYYSNKVKYAIRATLSFVMENGIQFIQFDSSTSSVFKTALKALIRAKINKAENIYIARNGQIRQVLGESSGTVVFDIAFVDSQASKELGLAYLRSNAATNLVPDMNKELNKVMKTSGITYMTGSVQTLPAAVVDIGTETGACGCIESVTSGASLKNKSTWGMLIGCVIFAVSIFVL